MRSSHIPFARSLMFLVFLAALQSGCASFEGTLDRSRTLRSTSVSTHIGSIAVAPVPRLRSSQSKQAAQRMARRLEMKLYHALRRALPEARVVGRDHLEQALAQKRGALERFTTWRTAYARSAKLNPIMVRQYAILAGVDYLLVVRKAELKRRYLPGEEAVERCPLRFCMGPRPHHIWRTDFEVVADLIDVRRGRLVWRGVGAALNDYAGDLEVNLLRKEAAPNPPAELKAVDDDLLVIASDGVARQIAESVGGG